MKVSELAKEYNLTSSEVLKVLKSLKLKAKDGKQELNNAVVVVLRSSLKKIQRAHPPVEEKAKPSVKESKVVVEDQPKEPVKKKAVKKKVAKKKTVAAKQPAKTKVEEKILPVAEESKKKTRKKAEPPAEEIVKEEAPAAVKPAAEKTAPTVQPKKVRPDLSDTPFVPLKPLGKRKKKTMDPRSAEKGRHDAFALDGSGDVSNASAPFSLAGSESAADDQPLKELEMKVPITVKDFAVVVQEKTSVVLKTLMKMGIFANINQNLGEDIVRKLAEEFHFSLAKVKTQEQQVIETHLEEDDDPALLEPRAPVVTFMGHVDHGKTSLLDRIRRSKITDSEHGGITQHIGAYSVNLPKGRIGFLDTPGHEAFTAMRARGAHITDIVVLVVAADEGIMPQTEEAIDHSRAAKVPIIVAINKIDRRNADVDRVKKQLSEHGLTPEDWDGNTICVGVSAVTGEGIDTLLEMILLESEMLELKANKGKKASGIVVEAHLSGGKGAVASLIVQSGTLKQNDVIVVGPYYGKVKAMFDDHERPIPSAGPSTPVEILGLPGVPEAGENFYVVDDEKVAKEITQFRKEQLKDEKLRAHSKITLEDLYSQIQEGRIKELNVILKSDVQGSVEALKDSLEKIPSDEVKVNFIHIGVGDVNASDVILAVASNAIIIAFHVGVGPRAQEELAKEPVDVRQYRIIYDAVNDVKKALEGLLEPRTKRKFLCRIEVRQVFKLSKSGMVAGCFVQKGKATRKADAEVVRNGEVIHTGKVSTLKRFKDDVREVNEGFECGVTLDRFDKMQPGDIIELFEIETIARTLA